MRLTPSEARALAQAANHQTISRPVRRRLQRLGLLGPTAQPTGSGKAALLELLRQKEDAARQLEQAKRVEESRHRLREGGTAQLAGTSRLLVPTMAMLIAGTQH